MSLANPVSTDAPLHIGIVTLVARDLGALAAFYGEVIGLETIHETSGEALLGAGGRALLRLASEPQASLASPRMAGLFHTAFLLPSRVDLSRWLSHAAKRIRLQGASDHWVSEAIYLADPEGNGIEVYADRPVSDWPRENGRVAIGTVALDVESLLKAGEGGVWNGAPAATSVGHIHLQVGDVDGADRFYRGVLGFEEIVRMPTATFLSSGGYHHHIGANTWNSRGAGSRPASGVTGLRSFELVAHDEAAFVEAEAHILASGVTAARRDGTILLSDPWNIGIELRQGAR